MVINTLGITAAVTGALMQQIGGGFGMGARGVVASTPAQFQQGFLQQAGTMGTATGRGIAQAWATASSQTVTGRPVSVTEESKSLQTLGDGTEISTSETTLFYRDGQGRTRVEQTLAGHTVVEINDPVAHTGWTLNSDTRTAHKTNPIIVVNPGEANSSGLPPALTIRMQPATGAGRGGRGGRADNNTVYEDLGVQSINGILATGTRSTLTIPQGAIGNNRDIHVVYERWYSTDLQMLVKTVNSDPRFGESTYELTNISRDEPDPALFQVPPEYTVVNGAGRGGRGAAPVTTPVINK